MFLKSCVLMYLIVKEKYVLFLYEKASLWMGNKCDAMYYTRVYALCFSIVVKLRLEIQCGSQQTCFSQERLMVSVLFS